MPLKGSPSGSTRWRPYRYTLGVPSYEEVRKIILLRSSAGRYPSDEPTSVVYRSSVPAGILNRDEMILSIQGSPEGPSKTVDIVIYPEG